MSYVQRQSTTSKQTLTLEEQNGRKTGLTFIAVTNFEQDTKNNGEYRATTGTDSNIGTPENKIPRTLIYSELPRGDYDSWYEQRENGGEIDGIEYAYQGPTDKYLLIGYMNQDGKVIPTNNAGDAVRNNFANFNAGKPGSDFTRNILARAQSQTQKTANDFAVADGTLEGSGGVANVPEGDVPGDAGLALGTFEEIKENKKDTDPASEADIKGENPPQVNLVTTDPVRITKKKGVLGFENKPDKQFRYPLAMINQKTDYLLIAVAEYNPAGRGLIRSRGELDSNTATNANKTYKGSIILPIPSNIQDGNSVKYGDSSLDGVTAAVAGMSIGVMESATSPNAAEALEKIKIAVDTGTKDLSGMGPDLAKMLTKNLAAQAASLVGLSNVTGAQLLARETGGIVNPNQELLFSGVTLRSFRFSFKMNPRNEDEAREIKSIIRVFKSNMAAKTATSDTFLSTPNVFDLTYMSGHQPHPFLHVFKTCALTDMSVNYTGDGLYATYGGKEKTPISMVMDLTFKELEAIYDEDYEKIEQGVGY